MSRGEPVLGFPSKRAAVIALSRDGVAPKEIAARIGSTLGAVQMTIQTARKRGELPPSSRVRQPPRDHEQPDATPGLWTPEKAAKVRRLCGKTLIYIAEAVEVPPAELLRYVIHGVIPPSQAVRRAEEIEWRGEALPAEPAPAEAPQLQLPAPFVRPGLDPVPGEPTAGEARAMAEAREAEEFAQAEAAERRRDEEEADLVGRLQLAFDLTATEALYLNALLDGRVKSKELLFDTGAHDEDVEIKIVDVMISKLRAKLLPHGAAIETVWGHGYRVHSTVGSALRRKAAAA